MELYSKLSQILTPILGLVIAFFVLWKHIRGARGDVAGDAKAQLATSRKLARDAMLKEAVANEVIEENQSLKRQLAEKDAEIARKNHELSKAYVEMVEIQRRIEKLG